EAASAIAADIGGPVVIKAQVLTGGRMKAGGVEVADTPEEAEAPAREILALEIAGHMPRGVLLGAKAEIKQEYYAGVIYDGIRKLPTFVFSDMGGIDIEEVAEQHPDHIGRGHFSTVLPHMDFNAKDAVASIGITGSELNRLTPILSKLARLFVKYDMTLAEINPLAQLADGTFVAVDAHMDMENEGRPRQKALLKDLGVADEETREAREPTKLVLSKPGVDKIAVMMSIVSNTRVDIVARGVIKACLELGYDPAEKVAVFRIPGAWEEEGFKILEKYGVEYYDRSVSMHEAAKRAVEKIGSAGTDSNGSGPDLGTAPGLEDRTSGEVTEAP